MLETLNLGEVRQGFVLVYLGRGDTLYLPRLQVPHPRSGSGRRTIDEWTVEPVREVTRLGIERLDVLPVLYSRIRTVRLKDLYLEHNRRKPTTTFYGVCWLYIGEYQNLRSSAFSSTTVPVRGRRPRSPLRQGTGEVEAPTPVTHHEEPNIHVARLEPEAVVHRKTDTETDTQRRTFL